MVSRLAVTTHSRLLAGCRGMTSESRGTTQNQHRQRAEDDPVGAALYFKFRFGGALTVSDRAHPFGKMPRCGVHECAC